MNITDKLNDLSVFTLSITTLTVANINLVVGIFTGLAGLGIQLYFKMEQNRRDRERHEWERNNNKK